MACSIASVPRCKQMRLAGHMMLPPSPLLHSVSAHVARSTSHAPFLQIAAVRPTPLQSS
jgi:hypothetical protein